MTLNLSTAFMLPARKVAAVALIVMAMFAVSVAPSMGSEGLSAVVPDSVESILDAAFGTSVADAGWLGAIVGGAVAVVVAVGVAVTITASVLTAPVWMPVVAYVSLVAFVGASAYWGYHGCC